MLAAIIGAIMSAIGAKRQKEHLEQLFTNGSWHYTLVERTGERTELTYQEFSALREKLVPVITLNFWRYR